MLAMELPSSGNVNSFTFEFDEMAYELASLFPHLELYSTGYLLDFEPYPVWKSPAGTSKVIEEFQPINLEIELKDRCDIVYKVCPICEEDLEINVSKV